MMKREGLGLPVILLLGILLVLMVVGTFFDYPVSQFLYGGPTAFGSFFAAFGELPAYFALYGAGVMLLRHRGKRTRFQDVFLLLGSIALILLGVLGQFCEYREDLPQTPFWQAVVVTLVLFAAYTMLTIVFLRNAAREDILRFIMATLFVCVISMLAANLLKYPFSRPRMRFLLQEPAAEFVPWYRSGWEQKKLYLSLGAGKDEFRSFPSGHMVTAAASLLWTFFPGMHRFFEGKGRLLFLFSVLWTALVAISRIAMGAHFLSDVTISWLFTLVLYLLANILFYRDSWAYRLANKILA